MTKIDPENPVFLIHFEHFRTETIGFPHLFVGLPWGKHQISAEKDLEIPPSLPGPWRLRCQRGRLHHFYHLDNWLNVDGDDGGKSAGVFKGPMLH